MRLLLLLTVALLAGCATAAPEATPVPPATATPAPPDLLGDEPVVMSFPSPDYGMHVFICLLYTSDAADE